MTQAAQNLNYDASKPSSIVNTGGLNASFTGTTNDAVLRFNAAGTVVGAGIVETTTAADGTSVAITRPGIYVVDFTGVALGGTTVHAGVSINVAAAGLTTDPSYAIAGFISVQQPIVAAADVGQPINFTGIFIENIKGQTSVVRFHATNGSDAAPVFTGLAAFFAYRITRLQDSRGHS